MRLAVVSLGPYALDTGRVTGGVLLTPLSLAVDLAMIAGVACLAAGGGGGRLDVPDIEVSSPPPPTTVERDRYWESLRTAASPPR